MLKRGLCCHPLSVSPSVSPSICLSVRHFHVLYPDGDPVSGFFDPSADTQFQRGTPSAGVQNTRSVENLQFLTEIAVYLGNGTR